VKFTDGFWMLRRGVVAHYPAEAREVVISPDAVTVHAPTRPVRHRGDTLNLPVVTVELRSPMPDVLAVTIGHWAGGIDRGTRFPVEDGGAVLDVDDGEDSLVVTSGRLSARLQRGPGAPWGIEFAAGGAVLTRSGPRAMAVLDTDDGRFVRDHLDLGVAEHVYGLGERFGPFVKNGQRLDQPARRGGRRRPGMAHRAARDDQPAAARASGRRARPGRGLRPVRSRRADLRVPLPHLRHGFRGAPADGRGRRRRAMPRRPRRHGPAHLAVCLDAGQRQRLGGAGHVWGRLLRRRLRLPLTLRSRRPCARP
jgi:hypothetical protein